MSIQSLYTLFQGCSGISTDSRLVKTGSLFFALSGPNFDGNEFALEALKKGAAHAVISDPSIKDERGRLVQVDDTLKTLQDLATHYRSQFQIPVIGITGTNGKTTTKELLTAVLSTRYKTHATVGNLNNHIGVPLSLLSMPTDTQIAVIEMGANHIGEIKSLCEIAQPEFGIITNVGIAHLEGFGNFEGVKSAKGELYDFLAENKGMVFLNQDLPDLNEMASSVEHIINYGSSMAELTSSNPNVELDYKGLHINSNIPGDYSYTNILAAICIGAHFDIEPVQIQEAIESYTPDQNRSQRIQKDGNTFILDAYNANPSNMEAALSHFAVEQASHKTLILGDMAELGADSKAEHQKLIDLVKDYAFEKVILVGQNFGEVNQDFEHFDDVIKLKVWFDNQHFKDTAFLIKGSRRMELEKLLD